MLVAVDTAGRVLELAHMMDQLWGNKVGLGAVVFDAHTEFYDDFLNYG